MTSKAWVGIDVACAKRKYLPIVICVSRNDRLIPLSLVEIADLRPPRGMGNARVVSATDAEDFASDAVAYVQAVACQFDLEISRIAIDSPNAPAKNGFGRRAAEFALDAAEIRYFVTPEAQQFDAIVQRALDHIEAGTPANRLKHANQLWMLAGFALFKAFSSIAECREVYPHAIVKMLGAADKHKTKEAGLLSQMTAAAVRTGWPEGSANLSLLDDIAFAQRHDNMDAYLAAWVASLDTNELDAFGEPPDDVIWVPKVSGRKFAPDSGSAQREEFEKSDTCVDSHCRLCPACHRHQFKRWPFGWDAHAAHRCTGLSATTPETRKQEFRMRFSSLFR